MAEIYHKTILMAKKVLIRHMDKSDEIFHYEPVEDLILALTDITKPQLSREIRSADPVVRANIVKELVASFDSTFKVAPNLNYRQISALSILLCQLVDTITTPKVSWKQIGTRLIDLLSRLVTRRQYHGT